MVEVSIVIVSYNVRDLLETCLRSIEMAQISLTPRKESLADEIRAEVVVVDSASSDHTADMVRQIYPWVRLLEPRINVGFSRGTNLGINAALGQFIFLLNPDTLVEKQAVVELVDFLKRHPAVGVVGPQLLNGDGSIQSSRRRFPSMATAFFESTWLQRFAPSSLLARYFVDDQESTVTQNIDWITGAAMMVRREVIDQIGLLDEGFYMYSEELDWQRRIKNEGWEIVFYPNAKIVHLGGKSSDLVPEQTHIAFQTSKVRYFQKYHGAVAGSTLRIFLLVSYASQLAMELAKAAIGNQRGLRLRRVKVFWRALRSGFVSS